MPDRGWLNPAGPDPLEVGQGHEAGPQSGDLGGRDPAGVHRLDPGGDRGPRLRPTVGEGDGAADEVTGVAPWLARVPRTEGPLGGTSSNPAPVRRSGTIASIRAQV